MKFLVDQNLPRRLAKHLSQAFPGTCHTGFLGLNTTDDQDIWELARDEGYIVISKDADFQHRSLTYGPPPKVIWMAIGNSSTREVMSIVDAHMSEIMAFVANSESGLLVIG